MHADKDPRGLLLLCVRTSCFQAKPRIQLRQHGTSNDRGYQVKLSRTNLIQINPLEPSQTKRSKPFWFFTFCFDFLANRIKKKKKNPKLETKARKYKCKFVCFQ